MSNLPPNPEELSVWAAEEIMGWETYKPEQAWWILSDKENIGYDRMELIKDWQPHLDTHLGQTFQCVEKAKKFRGLITWVGNEDDNFQVFIQNCIDVPIAQAENKSPALAILQALWLAKQGDG